MDTIVPRTFPYRPSGGFTPEEVWGGPAGMVEGDPVSGSTKETKDRLKMAGFRILDTLIDRFESKIRPATSPELRPGEGNIYTGPDIPIRIEGKAAAAPALSGVGLYVAVGLGVLLLVAMFKERGVR